MLATKAVTFFEVVKLTNRLHAAGQMTQFLN